MERYKQIFKESEYKDDDEDYIYLFKAQSQGGKAWIKLYQSEGDIEHNSYSIKGSNFMGGGQDIKLAKQDIIRKLLGSVIDGYGDIKKVDLDKIGLGKDWLEILNKLKSYRFLKNSKDAEQRKFYYSIIWKLNDSIRVQKSVISNISKFVNNIFSKIDDQIKLNEWI